MYLSTSHSGKVDLTRNFFRLGLYEKYVLIALWEEEGTISDGSPLLSKIANALLQHSSDTLKKERPVMYLRKLAREAKVADVERQLEEFDWLAKLEDFPQ